MQQHNKLGQKSKFLPLWSLYCCSQVQCESWLLSMRLCLKFQLKTEQELHQKATLNIDQVTRLFTFKLASNSVPLFSLEQAQIC